MLFPTTALKKNKCKTQTGGKDESRWECPPLSDGQALIGRDFISGFAHHWPHCSCFSILFCCLNPAPGGSVGAWQLMEQKGTWIAQPWGSFSQGPGFLCNLVVRKEALFCPHCKAGLGGCPWETALISSAPPFPCLLSPWRALGFSLGPDPDGRGIIEAAQSRTQPGLVWLLFLGRQLLGREPVPRPCLSPPPPFQTGLVSDDWGV